MSAWLEHASPTAAGLSGSGRKRRRGCGISVRTSELANRTARRRDSRILRRRQLATSRPATTSRSRSRCRTHVRLPGYTPSVPRKPSTAPDPRRAAPEGSIQVLEKASAVLDSLAVETDLSAAQLAERIGEPRSTVYRLLASLQSMEMVEPGPRRGSFRLGLRLLQLGSAVVARYDERQAALPAMEDLQRESGETVFLCIRRGLNAVCIERLDGDHVQLLALRIGGTLPLHAGGAPPVLLAFEPESFWHEYVGNAQLTRVVDGQPIDPSALLAELREIRRLGFAVSDEDVTVGIAALGAPIFNYKGEICASLSISGTKPAILGDRRNSVSRLVEHAERISRSLGHRPGEGSNR